MNVPDLERALADKRARQASGPRSIADLARVVTMWPARHYATYKQRETPLSRDHGRLVLAVITADEPPPFAAVLRRLCRDCEECEGSQVTPDGAPCPLCSLEATDSGLHEAAWDDLRPRGWCNSCDAAGGVLPEHAKCCPPPRMGEWGNRPHVDGSRWVFEPL